MQDERQAFYRRMGGGRALATWLLMLAGSNCALSAADPPTIASLPNGDVHVSHEWQLASYGLMIGSTGLQCADLDGDGDLEIVAMASNLAGYYWYIVSQTAGSYEIEYASPFVAGSVGAIRALRVGQIVGDERPEIAVVIGREFRIYDGQSRTEIVRFTPPNLNLLRQLRIADVDGDGAAELVFCDQDRVFVADARTGEIEWVDNYAATDLDVGNVDVDADREIVLATATSGLVINGRTHEREWEYFAGFGARVRLGDVDADGMDELVAAQTYYDLTVIDLDIRTPKVDLHTQEAIRAVEMGDVNADGTLEVVTVGGSQGRVRAFDGVDGDPLWTISSTLEMSNFCIAQLDEDGPNEIVVGAGQNFLSPSYLYIHDSQTQAREWTSTVFTGPFFGIFAADVDADGATELLLSNAGDIYTTPSSFYVLDGATHDVEYARPAIQSSVGRWRIVAANVDADPQSEIFVVNDAEPAADLRCYDGLTFDTQWIKPNIAGDDLQSLAVADIDLDGRLEIVAGSKRETFSNGSYVYVYDASSGALEWRSTNLSHPLSLLRLSQIDADPQLEIVIAGAAGPVFAYDGVSKILEVQTPDHNVSSLDTVAWAAGQPESIFVGTTAGRVAELDTSTGMLGETIGEFTGSIESLRFLSIGGGNMAYVYASDGTLFLRALDGSLLYSAAALGDAVAANDSIYPADIDDDGNIDIVVNAGWRGLHVFEVSFERRLGDMDCNGVVSVADIGGFVHALIDPAGYISAYPDCDLLNADFNGNGVVNVVDIGGMVARLSN